MVLWETAAQGNILSVPIEVGHLDLCNVIRAEFTVGKGNEWNLRNKLGPLGQCNVLWLLLHLKV